MASNSASWLYLRHEMLVIRLPSVLSGVGFGVSSDRVLSALYTFTKPVVDLEQCPSVPPMEFFFLPRKENAPDGEIRAPPVAVHNPAPEPALVLPPFDTAPLAHVPDIHLRVLGEAEQRAQARADAGPPERADTCVGFESGDHLGGARAPVDEVDVAAAAGDGEDVASGVERADVCAA